MTWINAVIVVPAASARKAAEALADATGDPREASGGGFVGMARAGVRVAVCSTAVMPDQAAKLRAGMAAGGIEAAMILADCRTGMVGEASVELGTGAGQRTKPSLALRAAGFRLEAGEG